MITAIAVAAEYWGNTSPEWWHYIFTVLGDFLLFGALLQGRKEGRKGGREEGRKGGSDEGPNVL